MCGPKCHTMHLGNLLVVCVVLLLQYLNAQIMYLGYNDVIQYNGFIAYIHYIGACTLVQTHITIMSIYSHIYTYCHCLFKYLCLFCFSINLPVIQFTCSAKTELYSTLNNRKNKTVNVGAV